jgi:hypothetical protein
MQLVKQLKNIVSRLRHQKLGGSDYNGKFVEFRVTCPNGEEQVIDSFEPEFDPTIYQFARIESCTVSNPNKLIREGTLSTGTLANSHTFGPSSYFDISGGQSLSTQINSPWQGGRVVTCPSGNSCSLSQVRVAFSLAANGALIIGIGPTYSVSVASFEEDRLIWTVEASFGFSNTGIGEPDAVWQGVIEND